jgi:hypothetical protein
MAYYKVRFEVWCDWDPTESSLRDIGQQVIRGDGAVPLALVGVALSHVRSLPLSVSRFSRSLQKVRKFSAGVQRHTLLW